MNEHDPRRNNKLLKSLRTDIAMWSEGKRPLSGWSFCALAVLLLALVGIFFAPGNMLKWFLVLPPLLLFQTLQLRMSPDEEWQERVDIKLAQYRPANLPAWKQLQKRVSEEGMSAVVLREWWSREAITVWPKARPDWKFLHNHPDEHQ